MEVDWHNNQQIIVQKTVIIPPPYRPEDCRAISGSQEALNRIKKILAGERKKLQEKEELERERKAVTPAGPRKGG